MAGAFPKMTSENGAGKCWRFCRFKIHWPSDRAPDFTIDMLLAHKVVGPVLQSLAPRIDWWRFHRRAARDSAGHRFSFLFYADSSVADSVIEAISRDPILLEALALGVIEEVTFSDPEKRDCPGLEDFSDPNW